MMLHWRAHGTKILGTAATVVSGVQLALPQLQNVVAPVHYSLTNFSLSVMGVVIGAMTVQRGFKNSGSEDPK